MKKKGNKLDLNIKAVEKGEYLREFIFGLNDGLVTTLSLLAGLTGAVVDNWIIVIGGLAEIISGSISMGLGAYISMKSEIEYFKGQIKNKKIGMWSKTDNPKKMGLTNAVAFVFGGIFPILPFIFLTKLSNPLILGTVFALIILFITGAVKSKYTGRNWIVSGLEMSFICLIAAGISFFAGRLIIYFAGG